LAARQSERVKSMRADIDAWAKEVNAPKPTKNDGTAAAETAKKKGKGKGKEKAE